MLYSRNEHNIVTQLIIKLFFERDHILYEMSQTDKSVETKQICGCLGLKVGRRLGVTANGYKASLGVIKIDSKIDCGDGCKTL